MGDGYFDDDMVVDNLDLVLLDFLDVLESLVDCPGDPGRYHWCRSSSCRNDFLRK